MLPADGNASLRSGRRQHHLCPQAHLEPLTGRAGGPPDGADVSGCKDPNAARFHEGIHQEAAIICQLERLGKPLCVGLNPHSGNYKIHLMDLGWVEKGESFKILSLAGGGEQVQHCFESGNVLNESDIFRTGCEKTSE